jgi:Glycosyl transferases group 1
MVDVRRVLSRRALTLASEPAAWRAASAQQLWRLRGPCPPPSIALQSTATHPSIYWPTEYQHANANPFGEPLRAAFGALTTVETRAIPQPYEGIVMLEVQHQFATFSIAVDYWDSTFVNQECLRQVSLYFKMQHRRSGYDEPKVRPGGYIASKQSLYDHYCRLRDLRRRPERFDVYGRFGTRFAESIRRRAVAALQRDSRFKFTGGTSLSLYMQSLREAACARVCIDMPGNGPFCHRLVEYLALGCCTIGPRHNAIMHSELTDREHVVYCKDDLSDLPEVCAEYVEDDHKREAVATNAARFFDEHLHPLQLASYYLQLLGQVAS